MIYASVRLPSSSFSPQLFVGMTQDAIRNMLSAQGVDFDFVTEDEYDAFIAANTPITPLLGN